MPNSGESPPAGYALPGTCRNFSSVNESESLLAAAVARGLPYCLLTLARQRLRALLVFRRLHLRTAALRFLAFLLDFVLRGLTAMTVPGCAPVAGCSPGDDGVCSPPPPLLPPPPL